MVGYSTKAWPDHRIDESPLSSLGGIRTNFMKIMDFRHKKNSNVLPDTQFHEWLGQEKTKSHARPSKTLGNGNIRGELND